MRSFSTLAASEALAREVEALRDASGGDGAGIGRAEGARARDAEARLSRAAATTALDEAAALRRELASREIFWREACEAQGRDLRTLAASAESRAAAATRAASAATRERDALRAALDEVVARERAELRERERERDMMDAAAAMGDVVVARRAFAAWLRGAAFNIRARTVSDKIEASARRRSLVRALERFRQGVRLSRIEREIERRANERLRRGVFVNWSVCCEVSRAGERSLVRRCLVRWSRFVADEKERARVFEDVESAVRTTRERAVVLLERARRSARMRSAFASWIIFIANSRRARMMALELIVKEREVAREAAIARVKARARENLAA